MTRIALLVVGFLAMSTIANATDLSRLSIAMDDGGVRIESEEIQATAMTITFDAAKDMLIFEGTPESSAELMISRTREGKVHTTHIRGSRIAFCPKTEELMVSGIQTIRHGQD